MYANTRLYLIYMINLKLSKNARILFKLPGFTIYALNLLCISGNWRVGKYLRNARSMGWECVSRIYSIRLSVQYLCKNIYHLHYSDCARSKSCSGRCIWDGYFSLIFSAIRQVSASYPAPPFCFFLSPLQHLAIFNLPELESVSAASTWPNEF